MITNAQLGRMLELELNTATDISQKPMTIDIEYLLNQAIHKFVKTRYTGNTPNASGFEQSEKRVNDLRKLIKTFNTSDLTETDNKYTISLPQDHMLTLQESVVIFDKAAPTTTRLTDVFECTLENLNTRMQNTLTDFHYRNGYARPLRINDNSTVQLYCDGTYGINQYTMNYLATPTKVDILNNPTTAYPDLTDEALTEVVKIAAQLHIERIKDQRYQTIVNETNTME